MLTKMIFKGQRHEIQVKIDEIQQKSVWNQNFQNIKRSVWNNQSKDKKIAKKAA